jgi:hypothetical protein
MPVSNPLDNSTVFIPHVNANYRLVIYTSEADADANNTAEAYVNVPFVSTLLGASGVGTAAYLDTGTAAGEIPTNADLGTAAQANTGTAPSEVPTNSDLPTFGATGATDVPTNANLSAAVCGTATFSGDVYTFTPSGAGFRPLQAGMYLSFRLPTGSVNTTTTPDFSYDSTTYTIKWIDGSALAVGDLTQTLNKQPIWFYFDGTDMLIASDISGGNSNGEWIKKADGGAIAFDKTAVSLTTVSAGSLWRDNTVAVTFPITFSAAPDFQSSPSTQNNWTGKSTLSTNSATAICVWDVVSGATSTIIEWSATGRWY